MALTSLIDRRMADVFDEDEELFPSDPVDGVNVPLDTGKSRLVDDSGKVSIEYLGDIDDDEGVVVNFGDERPSGAPAESELDHDANLANFLSPTDLYRIADKILDMVEADTESMAPWMEKIKRGLEIMGVVVTAEDDLPFDGASAVVHPMLAESVVQFNARSGAELMPPGGPCKGLVIGDSTKEKRDQADRLEQHMNYQMTEEDAGYYDEIDQLLFYLPFAGSAFTKTYRDDIHFTTTTRFIKAENVKMPYTASSLENSPRYTIMEKVHQNEMKKRMASGLYRDVPLSDPFDEAIDYDETQEMYDEAEGKTLVTYDTDARHDVAEVNIEYDLPGFEDTNALTGEKTGIALPYIITVDKSSRTTLAIRRNWRKDDPNRRRRHYLTHYKYLPGVGVMGFGLVHIMGGLAESVTGAVRALLDSAAWATLQGGFKSKDARFPAGQVVMRPGEWQDVDLTLDELERAFYTPPFKEPSRALFQMLELLEENGRRMAQTTEAVVGDANNNGPVGTTVALIEQGTKVMSGIHKRLHRSQRREFKIRAEINAEFMPEGQIYYDASSENNFITAQDYTNKHVNAVPVSDPNITSQTQRIAQAQALVARADLYPQLYRQHRVEYFLAESLGIGDADQFIRDPEKKHRCDAVSEGMKLMAGQPIFAFPDQGHEDHLAIHMAQIEYYKSLPEEQALPLINGMTEHLTKHEAYRVFNQMNAMMGGVLPPLDLYDDDPQEEMPPEVEMAATAQAARYIQQLMAQIQQNQPPPKEDAEAQAQIARADALAAADEKRKAAAHAADEERKTISFNNEQTRQDTSALRQKNEEKAPKPGESPEEKEAARKEELQAKRDMHKEDIEAKKEIARMQLDAKSKDADTTAKAKAQPQTVIKIDDKGVLEEVAKQLQGLASVQAEQSGEASKGLVNAMEAISTGIAAMTQAAEALAKAAEAQNGPKEVVYDPKTKRPKGFIPTTEAKLKGKTDGKL